jgi:hypothetical protein
MDGVQSFIARSSHRDEDQIEKTDTALAAVAVELLQGDCEFVCVVTTDINAGEGVVASLESNGFGNRAKFRNGFELIDEIT